MRAITANIDKSLVASGLLARVRAKSFANGTSGERLASSWITKSIETAKTKEPDKHVVLKENASGKKSNNVREIRTAASSRVDLLRVLRTIGSFYAQATYRDRYDNGVSLTLCDIQERSKEALAEDGASTSGKDDSVSESFLPGYMEGNRYQAAVQASMVSANDNILENTRWLEFYREAMTKVDQNQLQRQIELEVKANEVAADRYKKMWEEACDRGGTSMIGPTKDLVLRWFGPLSETLSEEIANISRRDSNPGRLKVKPEPYLALLEPEKLAMLTIQTALANCLHKSALRDSKEKPGACRLVRVSQRLGEIVKTEVSLVMLKENINRRLKALESESGLDPFATCKEQRQNNLKYTLQKIKFKRPERLDRIVAYLHRKDWNGENLPDWDVEVVTKIGAYLVSRLIKTATIEIAHDLDLEGMESEVVPAFVHKYMSIGRSKGINRISGHLAATDDLMKILDGNVNMHKFLHPKYLPMIVPPIPWTSRCNGGYLTHRTNVMRIKDSDMQRDYLKLADDLSSICKLAGRNGLSNFDHINGNPGGGKYSIGGNIGKVYDALNSLGATPWRVNGEVLDIMTTLWESDSSFESLRKSTGLPSKQEIPVPIIPEERFRLVTNRRNLHCFSTAESSLEKSDRTRKEKSIIRENRGAYSERCDLFYKMSTAREFRNEESIYFPHNLDFRGRAYPMHPYLNHLGSDVCRSLLQFSEGKPLGEDGMKWLLIHVCNLWGNNKISVPDREQYAKDNMDLILDSAKNPLDGRMWWTQADNPFQCLATCIEIAKALDSGSPSTYISKQPVHQDGSCNGLQHYAALSKDEEGARAVNLLPSDLPQDVYSKVAAYVAEAVEKDAHDSSSKNNLLAQSCLGEVDRKLVKQTVMTSVYGVTHIGAREQVYSRLRERGWNGSRDTYRASQYLSLLIMNALERAFKNAKDTMKWLSLCAQLVSAQGGAVTWTTPLGLPVVQPYKRKEKITVVTLMQRMVLEKVNENMPVQKQKQKTAFPPNYVHSLDSSHLLMTASDCSRRDVTFAGVHDSFWTHACTVDEMNKVLRDKFIELHSQPLLEILLSELEERYPQITFPPMPELGTLDLNEIRNSTYFFS